MNTHESSILGADQQFLADMIRCRGIEFAYLGMRVEADGKAGSIKGINYSSNLDVQFDEDDRIGNCHPFWRMKYYDAAGTLIAHFDDDGCVLRPTRETDSSSEQDQCADQVRAE